MIVCDLRKFDTEIVKRVAKFKKAFLDSKQVVSVNELHSTMVAGGVCSSKYEIEYRNGMNAEVSGVIPTLAVSAWIEGREVKI